MGAVRGAMAWGVAALAWLPVAAAGQGAVLPAMPEVSLPTLALEPAPEPSIWHGLSVGTEVVAVSSKGGGGVGADVFGGYDHVFDNHVVLGIRGSTGYLPAWGNHALYRGFDVGAVEAQIGYDMGRVMPFVTVGAILARPHLGAGLTAPGGDSLTAVLNGGGDTRTLTNVGAGVTYALTDSLSIGVAVNAIQGRGALLP